MRTAGVLEDWGLKDYQSEYQCVLDSFCDGLEARLIDGNHWYKDNRDFCTMKTIWSCLRLDWMVAYSGLSQFRAHRV